MTVAAARSALAFRLAAATLFEISYAVLTRTWLRGHVSGAIKLELVLTVCRLATLFVYWRLFRDLLKQPRTARKARVTPALIGGLALLLLVPLLFYGGYPADSGYRLTFALTSVVVAIREEVLYRGIVQRLLEQRCGALAGLVLSNILFVLYHYGAQPFSISGVTELFAMGCVLGLLYAVTGSLLAPIALHAVYDAIWSVGPLLDAPLADPLRIPLHLAGLALLVAWAAGVSREKEV